MGKEKLANFSFPIPGFFFPILFDPYFLIRQVTGGVFGPHVAVHGLGAGAEVAAADVEETAFCATALHVGAFVLHLVQQLDFRVDPDFGEGAFQHVAEYVFAPELVGVNLAVPRYAADAPAGAVAFVELEQFEHFLGTFGVFFLHPHPQIGAVGVVVHGEHFFGVPLIEQFAGFVHDEVDRGPGFGVIQVFLDQLGAPARVDQMVKAHAGDVPIAQYVENFGYFCGIAFVDGEAQADLDALFLTVFQAFKGAAVRALDAPETVVHVFAAVQGHSHVRQAHAFERLGHVAVNQGAVGGDDRPHAFGRGVFGQFGQVLADQGFPAGKQHDRRAEGRQIVDHDLGAIGGNGVFALFAQGFGVTMHAFKITPAGHVPDDHRFFVGGKLQQMGRQFAGLTPVTQSVRGFHLAAVKFGNTNHGGSLLDAGNRVGHAPDRER